MNAKKKYLIDVFTKIIYNKNNIDKSIEEGTKIIRSAYFDILDIEVKDILKKYNYKEYHKRLVPIIDNFFSEKELQETIKFFSSPTGRKLLNNKYLSSFQKVEKQIFYDIEKDFILKNNKK